MVRNYITHDSAYFLILFGMVWWEVFLFIFFKRTFWFWIDFSIFAFPESIVSQLWSQVGRNFHWTLLENDGTCDHSWLTILSGNAPQDELLFLFLSAAQTHTHAQITF